MSRSIWPSLLLIAGALLMLPATAQAEVRYIASTGDDDNPCTRAAAPCRTLQHGIDVTPGGGELRVLDSGNFGAATIGKSLTVAGDGVTIFGGITIDEASAIVALRGLDLSGTGLASFENGITVAAASTVYIEHCTAERFPGAGLYGIAPNVSVFVTDSIFRDNANSGIVVIDSGHTASLTVDNSHFDNNHAIGLDVVGTTSTITRSVASGNAEGIRVEMGGRASISFTTATQNWEDGYLIVAGPVVTLESSLSHGNGGGLDVFASNLTLSNSVIVNNPFGGVGTGSGVAIKTRGNNTVTYNGNSSVGPPTLFTPLAGR